MAGTEYVDLAGVAKMAGIGIESARTYHTRAIANRRAGKPKPGDLPEPNLKVGNSPAWKAETIREWLSARPGRGVGGGRPRRDDVPRGERGAPWPH